MIGVDERYAIRPKRTSGGFLGCTRFIYHRNFSLHELHSLSAVLFVLRFLYDCECRHGMYLSNIKKGKYVSVDNMFGFTSCYVVGTLPAARVCNSI